MLGMVFDLIHKHGLRGYAFEKIAKIILRHSRKNAFIFCTSDFTDLREVELKYRFNLSFLSAEEKELINSRWNTPDIIEFVLNNTAERKVLKIIFYEVKSYSPKSHKELELCKKAYYHYVKLKKANFMIYLIKFSMLPNWRFNYEKTELDLSNLYIYSRLEKRRPYHVSEFKF